MKEESEGQSPWSAQGLHLGEEGVSKGHREGVTRDMGGKQRSVTSRGQGVEEVSWCGCHLCLLIAGETGEPRTGQRQNPGFFWMRTKKGLSGKRFVHFTLIDNFAHRAWMLLQDDCQGWVFFRVHFIKWKNTTKKSLRAYWVYSTERNHWGLRTVSLPFWESSSANSLVSANNARMFSLVPKLRCRHTALISRRPWQSSIVFGNVCRFSAEIEAGESACYEQVCFQTYPKSTFFSLCKLSDDFHHGA